MKIAVIGTGAAAFGVRLGLREKVPAVDITFFDVPGGGTPSPSFVNLHPKTWPKNGMADVIARGRRGIGRRGLMPPRSYFGDLPFRNKIMSGRHLLQGKGAGGLTRFWSGSMYNLTPGDFTDWPISFEELVPYYLQIAEAVGISGTPDRLDSYFALDYANRPPVARAAPLQHLAEAINARGDDTVLAGINRLAIDTDPASPQACVACGECLTGCFRDSIFCGQHALNETSERVITDEILRVDVHSAKRKLVGKTDTYTGFDHVFVAAGCLSSAEIVLRSVDAGSITLPLVDNPMYLFPLINPSLNPFRDSNDYVAISNHAIAFLPDEPGMGYVHALLTPVPNLLGRNLLPRALWSLSDVAIGMARNMMAVANLYFEGHMLHRYNVSLDEGKSLRIHHEFSPETRDAQQWARRRFGTALTGTGWYSLYSPFIDATTSAHYAGPLAYGGSAIPINRTGTVLKGVHVCDSSVFPTSPAQPPTFTIMANAARTAEEVLSG